MGQFRIEISRFVAAMGRDATLGRIVAGYESQIRDAVAATSVKAAEATR